MAQVADHLSVAELQAGYRGSGDATLPRHYQTIWLLKQGRTIAETAALTSFAPRWIEQLLARYAEQNLYICPQETTCDPERDFDHPKLREGLRLRPHVLFFIVDLADSAKRGAIFGFAGSPT